MGDSGVFAPFLPHCDHRRRQACRIDGAICQNGGGGSPRGAVWKLPFFSGWSWTQSKVFTAALKRCATRNQVQWRRMKPCLLRAASKLHHCPVLISTAPYARRLLF